MDDKKPSIENYKGTRDFYPEEQALQNFMFERLRRVSERYGYVEYNASVIEETELYRQKSGEEIVNEQTYSFTDRGGREVTIRPEMTPTVARMIARKRKELTFPLRWYSLPNLLRYERPQRGRLREHWQLNVDIFGVSGEIAEIELILMAESIMTEFGATAEMYEIRVGHRGLTNEIMRSYFGLPETQAHALTKLLDRKNKMSAEDFHGAVGELLGERTEEFMQVINSQGVEMLPESVRESESAKELANLISKLHEHGVENIVYDPTLMRGFDYYTGIVFEVFDLHPENNRSLFGGGRYDDLVTLFGVEEVTGAGFGIGDVTLRDFLEVHGLLPESLPRPIDAYLCLLEEEVEAGATSLAEELRRAGLKVFVDYSYRKVGSQLKSAEKKGSRTVLCLGGRELTENQFTVKRLPEGGEESVSRADLANYLSSTD